MPTEVTRPQICRSPSGAAAAAVTIAHTTLNIRDLEKLRAKCSFWHRLQPWNELSIVAPHVARFGPRIVILFLPEGR